MKKPLLFIVCLVLIVLLFGNSPIDRNPYADRNGDGMPDDMPLPSCDLVQYGVPQYACSDGSQSMIESLIQEFLP